MELSESTRMFSVDNPFAINQNSSLNDAQGELLSFNQMAGMKDIAFIDTTVTDYENLVAGIVPNTEIVLLDPTRDGVEQITQVLVNRTELSSAHIISHGDEGSLQLGTTHLNLDNLNQYHIALEKWKNALTPDADILLYGCNVAAGEKGTAFVQSLSQITDADIAASDDLTGSAALGADWDLEVKTGAIEATLALEAEIMAGYDSVLLTFSPATQFGTGVQPQSVTAHDFNGDGHLDLALPTRASGAVSILLGDSTGNFGKATNFQAGQYPFDVAVGNFNNDSFPDIAAANWGTSNVSILLGDGTGSFKAATNFSVGTSPWSVEAGDFNADGKLDLATANIDSNNVSILLGDGTGSFSTATNFSVGLQPQFVGVGDFNADSKLDLATANFNSNNVSILLGTGTGSFGTATNFSVGSSPYALAVSDLNADGKADLAVANEGSNSVSVLLGTGTGSFGGATNFSVGSAPRFVAVGDLNTDGKLDLATANLNSDNVSILLGTGTGNFNPATNFSTGAGTGPWTVAISDLNKDGAPDLATPNYWTNNVSVLLNTKPLVNFGAATYKATEESNDAIVNIPVTLSATPGTDVTVPIVINNGSTATEGDGNDYLLSTNSVTFKAGASGDALTQNIAVTIKPDNIPENDETVILDFGTITAAAAGTTKQTTLTIGANDAVNYAVSAGVANIQEANSSTTPLTFTVTRSGGIDAGSKVDFAIGGTAANNSDYKDIGGTSGATGTTGTITFTAGETQKTITMNVVGDTAVEPDETVIVSLSNPVAPGPPPTISNVSAITTINNDDTVPQPGTLQFTAANFSVPEGNSGGFVNSTAVTVNRTGGSSGAVSVQVRVNPNNAGTANPNDYNNNAFPITVNFADGDTAAKTVIIPINGDTTVEPDETVNLELIPGTVTGGATIGSQNTAILTITNDDAPSSDSGGNSIGAASVIAVASTTKTYSDWVGTADTNDYYKFSLGTNNNFSLSLNKLSADANVQLLNSSGNVIANSSNFGTTPESISRTLDQGTYYVHVSSVGDASTYYDLNLSVTPLVSGITTTGSDAPIYIAGELISATNSPFIAPQDVESSSLIKMDKFRADPCFAGINGSGFSTVILDTGIDLNHPFFGPDNNLNGVADRIVYSYDYADGDADASDFNGHGSNVSSIVASQNGTLTGMAPGANIIHLKVFPNIGSGGSFSYVEQALQWVVANAEQYNIASVNMSLGDSGNYNTNTPQTQYGISDELAQLAQKNVIVVSASGNSFYNFGSTQGVAYPSADPNSLSIGAVYDSNVGSFSYGSGAIANSTGSDRITPFSQRHQTLTTIFAPGAPTTGAGPTGGTITMHGTSQAAPHIAGIAVLAQQLAVKELGHRLTPNEFSNLLKSSGTTINDGDDENDNVINTGLNFKRVDMLALAKAIHVNQAPEEKIHLAETNTYRSGSSIKDVFTDPDGDLLTYTATKSDGTPLPAWLQFSFNSNNNTITFTEVATPPSNWQSFQVKLTATDPCSASASQTFSIIKESSGWVIDSYIAGATIFFDANKNGVIDNNEPSRTTDNSGAYQLDISPVFDTNNNGKFDPEEGYLVAYGGTDTATGLPLETPLIAPASASVVTLLTSLVAELNDRGINLDRAESQVKAALSLPSDVNLTSLDPIAATNNKEPGGVEVLAAMVKVQNFITQTKGLIDGALGVPENIAPGKNDIVQGIVSTIVNQVESGVILDFSNPEQLAVIIEASVNKTKQLSPTFNPVVNSEFIASSAKIMAQVNQHIDKIVANTAPESIHQQIARVQKVALGDITSDFKGSASGAKSINEVIAENSGAALNTQIQTATIPGVTAVPIINHLPKFDSTLLFDSDFYLQQYKDVAEAVANKLFPDALAHFSQFGWAEGRNPSSMFATDYLNKNSDVAAAVDKGFFHSGFEHFVKYGMAENRAGTSEFTRLETFYLSQNSDVAEAVGRRSLGSGIEHLVRLGMTEGRNPFTPFNVISETFDPTFYLAKNQDVAEAVSRGVFRNAFEHFVWFGLWESRDPSILFENTSYLAQNSDVAVAVRAGIFHSGLEHFIKYGMAEGRAVRSTLS